MKPELPNKLKVKIQESFISPLFYNEFIGRQYILDSAERTILNKNLVIENDPGTKLIVFGGWNPYAYDYNKYTEYKNQLEIERENEIKERKLFYENLKQEAIQFNKSLNLPVKWTSEIKQVLSGLSEGSFGDGTKKNTVHHIYLHEELIYGKLKRTANEFLCSPVKAKYNGNWSGTLGTNGFEVKVSCKKCLKIAERFNENINNK